MMLLVNSAGLIEYRMIHESGSISNQKRLRANCGPATWENSPGRQCRKAVFIDKERERYMFGPRLDV